MRGLPDYLLLGSSVLLSLVGVSLAWGFRRARAIESFKQVVAAEATLLARLEASHPDAGISVAGNLLLRRVPREPWGWWKRRKRWWHHWRTTGGKVQHFQLLLLVKQWDGTFNPVLMWEAAASTLDAINQVARIYGHQEVSPDDLERDLPEDEHAVVELGDGSYLFVEPALRKSRWHRHRDDLGTRWMP